MSETFDVTSPFDQSTLETIAYHTAKDVDSFLCTANERKLRIGLSVSKRSKILLKTAELLNSKREAFAMTIAQEGGKPLMDARVEVERAIQGIHNAIEVMNASHGTEIPMGRTPSSEHRLAFTTREPIGVVVAVSAFNHPLNLIVHQIIPAIATGCPVIVKPASATPLSCRNFVALLKEAGLPDGWCQAIYLKNKDATALVTDPRVDFFSFIGSAKIGWWLRSQLAPGTRCALEHGGLAPVIVEADADLQRIVPLLVKGGFYHAGQVCVSTQRIYAHKSIADKLIDALAEKIKQLKVGDATLPDTEVGPLISRAEVDRVDEWVKEAIAEGAEIIVGSGKLSDSLYSPTLIKNPKPTSKVCTSEVFGPVVCVTSYENVDDAIDLANGLSVSFQASVCTQDIDKAFGIAKRIHASTVMINDHTAFRVDWMPFAGYKTSGLGTGGIPHTMRDMTQEKMIVVHSPNL